MTEWKLYSLCPGCNESFHRDSARFFAVCPSCGHRGEWEFGPKWKQEVARYVHIPFPGFRWLDPRTWFRGRWERQVKS
jgi:hypothetical protein